MSKLASATTTQPAFDAGTERARIAETLLRSAGRLMLDRNEHEIVAGVCDMLTRTSPHIRLAWTWFGLTSTEYIVPQVCAGPAREYARKLVIRRNLLTTHGPAFRALEGHAAEPFNVSALSPYGPWRQAAAEYGVRNALALPLPSGLQSSGGIFVLYADTPDYFSDVGVGLFEALAELFGSVLTLAAERQELEQTAYTDALTGLLNRHAQPLVERRLRRDTAFKPRGSVLLMDLDHFKRINDAQGHAGGDRVLQAAAHAVRHTLRRGDDALRWGGEEFMVVLPGTPLADALAVAEKLRRVMADMEAPNQVCCSIGVAELGAQESLTEALVRADRALYRAKDEGRNCVRAAEASSE